MGNKKIKNKKYFKFKFKNVSTIYATRKYDQGVKIKAEG